MRPSRKIELSEDLQITKAEMSIYNTPAITNKSDISKSIS